MRRTSGERSAPGDLEEVAGAVEASAGDLERLLVGGVVPFWPRVVDEAGGFHLRHDLAGEASSSTSWRRSAPTSPRSAARTARPPTACSSCSSSSPSPMGKTPERPGHGRFRADWRPAPGYVMRR